MTDQQNSIPYEDRYVAYFDILGFTNLVRRIDSDPALLHRVVGSLKEAQAFAPLGPAMDQSAGNRPGEFFFNMFHMSTFSDSIAISAKANPIGLSLVMFHCAFTSTRLMGQGVFVRGAITRGKLYHSDGIVVGEGLISAYLLESKAAIYPRIVIADDVLADFARFGGLHSDFLDLRRQDFDGLWHVNVFRPEFLKKLMESSRPDRSPIPGNFMSTLRAAIIVALDGAEDAGVRAKAGWIARYFNEYASEYRVASIPIHSNWEQ